MVRIVVFSDTHTFHDKVVIPECDILLCAGDFSFTGTIQESYEFLEWFSATPAREKIYICGNHELDWERAPWIKKQILREFSNLHYLENDYINLFGLKIWGSPYSLSFMDWSYQLERDRAELFWSQIPDDADIIMTHGPCFGFGDTVKLGKPHLGDPWLLARVEEIQPKLHIGAHVHGGYSKIWNGKTCMLNASICTEKYKPENKPWEIEIGSVDS